MSGGFQRLPCPPSTQQSPGRGAVRPGYPTCRSPLPHRKGCWSQAAAHSGSPALPSARSLPGGLGSYQPFMFWSLYSIFFPSSLGWILRGNSRWVNSFPSSSGLRNACGTKRRLSCGAGRAGSAQHRLPRRVRSTSPGTGTAAWDPPACQDLGYGRGFRNRVPAAAVTRDEERQSPFPRQHPQPQGLLEHSVQGSGHRDSVGKCRWRKKEVKERRALGNIGGFGTEAWRAPSCSGGGPDMPWGPCSRASVHWPPACALPSAASCGGSRSQRFPPLGHSKIDSRKNASVFFQVRCKPGNRIQQDLLQHKRLLLCAAVREVFITLKSLPVRRGGICPGQAGEGAFRKKTRNPLARVSSVLPREQPGKKLGLSASAAAPSTVRGSVTGGGSGAVLPPVTAPAIPVLPQQQAGAQPGQAMLPVPQAGAGQGGPNWLHATVPNRPHAESPGRPGSQARPLTLTPQQTSAPPATRFPRASEPGQLLRPSASPQLGELAGMDKCRQQVPAVGLPRGAGRWFSRNEVRRKVFLTKNCSLCLSVSGVNSLDIGMISPLRMIMALQ